MSNTFAWRQGNCLTRESAQELNLVELDSSDDHCIIVISHDCDIANTEELNVEYIVAKKIIALNGLLIESRNIRRLHISYNEVDSSQQCYLELLQSEKKTISKSLFLKTAIVGGYLLEKDKRVLKQWLSARYGRPSYPDEFNKRLSSGKFLDKLKKLLKPVNHLLTCILFDLSDGKLQELPEDELYYLSVSFVYSGIESLSIRPIIEEFVKKFKDLFYNIFGISENSRLICLERCEAVSDTFITLADIQKVDQWWHFDYISYEDVSCTSIPFGIRA